LAKNLNIKENKEKKMQKTIFITATDTGVGKTTVSAAIAKIAKEAGINVGYFKPVETGCNPDCLDAKLLAEITGQPYEEIVLYRFKNPVAPLVAEREEGLKISVEKINNHLKVLKEKYQFLIVEGAGGVAVPITKIKDRFYTYIDFASENNLKTVVVSRATLGTINHTFLTVKALKDNNIEVAGIILNKYPENPTLSEKTNPHIIKEMTGVDIISICKEKKNCIKECGERLKNFLEFFLYII
jgi:dethiobiotin synthetase